MIDTLAYFPIGITILFGLILLVVILLERSRSKINQSRIDAPRYIIVRNEKMGFTIKEKNLFYLGGNVLMDYFTLRCVDTHEEAEKIIAWLEGGKNETAN
jgi:hypothetical protein